TWTVAAAANRLSRPATNAASTRATKTAFIVSSCSRDQLPSTSSRGSKRIERISMRNNLLYPPIVGYSERHEQPPQTLRWLRGGAWLQRRKRRSTPTSRARGQTGYRHPPWRFSPAHKRRRMRVRHRSIAQQRTPVQRSARPREVRHYR